MTFTGGIAIWDYLGRSHCLQYIMFAQFLKTTVRPLHVSYCRSFCGGLIYFTNAGSMTQIKGRKHSNFPANSSLAHTSRAEQVDIQLICSCTTNPVATLTALIGIVCFTSISYRIETRSAQCVTRSPPGTLEPTSFDDQASLPVSGLGKSGE